MALGATVARPSGQSPKLATPWWVQLAFLAETDSACVKQRNQGGALASQLSNKLSKELISPKENINSCIMTSGRNALCCPRWLPSPNYFGCHLMLPKKGSRLAHTSLTLVAGSSPYIFCALLAGEPNNSFHWRQQRLRFGRLDSTPSSARTPRSAASDKAWIGRSFTSGTRRMRRPF